MNRIVLLGLALVALAAAQYNYEDSPFLRRKRQAETPFVGQEEGREQNTGTLRHGGDDDERDDDRNDEEDFGGGRHHHNHDDSDGDRDDDNDDSGDDTFEDGRRRFGPGTVLIMTPQGPIIAPQRVVVNPDGSLTVLNPDGSIIVPQPQVLRNPDGSFTLLPPAIGIVPEPQVVQNSGVPVMTQNPDGSLAIQDPSLAPIPAPLPAPEPASFGQEEPLDQDGNDAVLISFPPQPLPEPAAQQGFRGPSGNEGQGGFRGPTTTTEAPVPQSNRPSGFFPPSTLTCSSVRCPSGAVCRMENSRFSRREEPVCVFTGSNAPSSCSQVRCSSGFECEMQQSSSCSRLPCPSNPVCVQTPVTTPAPPFVSCDAVRCSAGTVCRIQAVDHCTSVPCAMQAACVSACTSFSCPSNQECRVDDRTLRPTCVNMPAQSPTSCRDIRCNRNERCVMVQNCHWSRQCREEPKCMNF